jgi:hypothetical protein
MEPKYSISPHKIFLFVTSILVLPPPSNNFGLAMGSGRAGTGSATAANGPGTAVHVLGHVHVVPLYCSQHWGTGVDCRHIMMSLCQALGEVVVKQ